MPSEDTSAAANKSQLKSNKSGTKDEVTHEAHDADEVDSDAEEEGLPELTKAIPSIPDSSAAPGVLPRVIRTLVERRKYVLSNISER